MFNVASETPSFIQILMLRQSVLIWTSSFDKTIFAIKETFFKRLLLSLPLFSVHGFVMKARDTLSMLSYLFSLILLLFY